MSKLAMRRTWFQVHKWIGLMLAVLIIPVSVTGAALVWHDALDELVNPQRYATSGDDLLSPQAYVDAAKTRLAPGERVAQLTLPDDHGGPIIVAAARALAGKHQAGPPSRTMLYLDPPTARVLDVADNRSGLVRVLHQLHGSLLVPGLGRQIVGWIGVFMMVSCFTGLWLWWPTVGRWARGLRWKRHRNTDTNLHYLTGFWVALPLFVLSLTGAWISFPAFFGGLVGEGQRGQQRGPDRAALMRAKPLDAPATPLMEVLGRAAALGRGDLRSVTWPTDLKSDWSIAFTGVGGPVSVSVADDSGTAALAPPRQQGGVARLMRRIHDGTGMGIVWQVLIFLGGIIPAILGVTGIIMWWRARGWKAELAEKQRARRAPVAAE
jgi:uncharacterized iron-regulated membrane protein